MSRKTSAKNAHITLKNRSFVGVFFCKIVKCCIPIDEMVESHRKKTNRKSWKKLIDFAHCSDNEVSVQ